MLCAHPGHAPWLASLAPPTTIGYRARTVAAGARPGQTHYGRQARNRHAQHRWYGRPPDPSRRMARRGTVLLLLLLRAGRVLRHPPGARPVERGGGIDAVAMVLRRHLRRHAGAD